MGRDFSALIHYPGPTDDLAEAITRLEAGGNSPGLHEVVECGRRLGFAFTNDVGHEAVWRRLDDWERTLPLRPVLPSLQAALELPSGFSLTFGADTVWVSHLLRWIFFVTEGEWQPRHAWRHPAALSIVRGGRLHHRPR